MNRFPLRPWRHRSISAYPQHFGVEFRTKDRGSGPSINSPPRQPRRSRAALAAGEGSDHVDVRARAQDQILDEIDRRVIKILQDDGRRPNTEIARELHVSETTIRKRVSQLVSRGLINIVAASPPRRVRGEPACFPWTSSAPPHILYVTEALQSQKTKRPVPGLHRR